MGYYGIDIYYIILVLPAIIFAMWAQSKVNTTFNKYSKLGAMRGITGDDTWQAVTPKSTRQTLRLMDVTVGSIETGHRFLGVTQNQ